MTGSANVFNLFWKKDELENRKVTQDQTFQLRERLSPDKLFKTPSLPDQTFGMQTWDPKSITKSSIDPLDPTNAPPTLAPNTTLTSSTPSVTDVIFQACKLGDISTLQKVLAVGNFNAIDADGRTPLICAVMAEQYQVVKFLLTAKVIGGSSPQAFIQSVKSKIYTSTKSTPASLVRVNVADKDGKTAIHWACQVGSYRILKRLLQFGGEWRLRDQEGRNGLHLCIHYANSSEIINTDKNAKRKSCFELLLARSEVEDLLEADNEKMTILHWAVLYNQDKNVQRILKHGGKTFNIQTQTDIQGKTPLHLAATLPSNRRLPNTSIYTSTMAFSITCAQYLLQHDVSIINTPDMEGLTSLHLACAENNLPLVHLLASYSICNINARDQMGRTSLHWASLAGNASIVQLLLARGANDAIVDSLIGASAMHYACSKNHAQCVSVLLERVNTAVIQKRQAAEANKMNADERSLKKRLSRNSSKVFPNVPVIQIISDGGANANEVVDGLVEDGVNIIEEGIQESGNDNVVLEEEEEEEQGETQDDVQKMATSTTLSLQSMGKKKINGSYIPDLEGRYPLAWAVSRGHVQTCRVLLQEGVDVNATDNEGCAPLHIAATSGKTMCAALLLEYGANVDALDNQHHSPLFRAVQHGYTDIATLLIQYGASQRALDKDGRSLLHWAAGFGHLTVCSLLIANGVLQVNVVDAGGRTPLQCAATIGSNDIVKFLVENSANVNKRDNNGLIALHYASACGHVTTTQLLVELGSHINALDFQDPPTTPLGYSLKNGHIEVSNYLRNHGGKMGTEIFRKSVIMIQAVWRGYHVRKTLRPRQNSKVVHKNLVIALPPISPPAKMDASLRASTSHSSHSSAPKFIQAAAAKVIQKAWCVYKLRRRVTKSKRNTTGLLLDVRHERDHHDTMDSAEREYFAAEAALRVKEIPKKSGMPLLPAIHTTNPLRLPSTSTAQTPSPQLAPPTPRATTPPNGVNVFNDMSTIEMEFYKMKPDAK